ncbi:MAG: 30S ribosome-binding factor RbfA [Alphaproteobacteria bacterium]
MRSERQLRVGEEIRHALAAVFQRSDFHWPEDFTPPAAITVTEVRVSPDLRNATAYVMPLGGGNIAPLVKVLNGGIGFFRHVIAKEVKLRFVPNLTFAADESFDYAKKIEGILHDPSVAKDLNSEEKS